MLQAAYHTNYKLQLSTTRLKTCVMSHPYQTVFPGQTRQLTLPQYQKTQAHVVYIKV